MSARARSRRAGRDRSAPTCSARCPTTSVAGFEAHLAGCAACREEVEQLRVAADALPASPPPIAPPPELKGADHGGRRVRGRAAARPPGRDADRAEPRRAGAGARALAACARPALALPRVAARCSCVGVGAGVLGSGAARRRGHAHGRRAQVDRRRRRRAPRSRCDDDHAHARRPRPPAPPAGPRLPGVAASGRHGARADRRAVHRRAATARRRSTCPGSLEDVDAVIVTDEPRGGSRRRRRAVLTVIARRAALRGPLRARLLASRAAMATCYRHPDRETGVSCSNCGRPICPDCMTPTPVGMRCPECSRRRRRSARCAR